ncbi:MAG: aldehyde dehydrogenase family protein, partial [Pseudomonadota bacterium]|nr:aldehyde dehydrogenase family protein [Pseudomonadota bacterium]
MADARIINLFHSLGVSLPEGKMPVPGPRNGETIASLAADTPETIDEKITRARIAQQAWQSKSRNEREEVLEALAGSIRAHRELLATLMTMDSGKTMKESLGEADGSEAILYKTIKDASLPEFNNMYRCKERVPAGLIGLITSFNFPLVVAHWTIAPALLAGNAVLWKPSEKTPLVALAVKALFDRLGQGDLLHIVIGGREAGTMLVGHEGVDMVSATGSVGMGKAILAALEQKKNNSIKPILELGGNNGVVISDKISEAHLEWSVKALLNSFLGTAGQRCTNTRRVFVQRKVYDRTMRLFERNV